MQPGHKKDATLQQFNAEVGLQFNPITLKYTYLRQLRYSLDLKGRIS